MAIEVAFSLQAHAFDNSVRPQTVDWPNMVETLFTSIPVKPDKSRSMAITPAVFTHVGKGYRKNEYVVVVTCLVIDIDKGLTPEKLKALLDRLTREGVAYVVHYTSSCYDAYKTRGEYKVRVIMPLAEPVPAKEWPTFWEKARVYFSDWAWDLNTKNTSRLYYLPSAPSRAAVDWMLSQPWLTYDVNAPFLNPDVIRAVKAPTATLTATAKRTPITSTPLHVLQSNLRERLRTLKADPRKQDLAMALGAMLDGTEYSTEGERNPTMNALGWYIAAQYPHHDPQVLAKLFERSQDEMAHTHAKPPDTLDKIADNIARAQAKHLQAAADRGSIVTSREARFMREVAGSDDADYRYTDADKAEIAAGLDVTVEELNDRWLMVDPTCRDLFMVGKNGIYSCVNNQLAWATERLRLLPTGLPLTTVSKQGHVRSISLNDFAEKHGRTLSYVAYDNRLQTHRLTKDNGLLLPCLYSDIQPAFNERADAFFRSLFGKQYDTAQKWFAFFCDTREIIPALILIGPKDVGKNLLASGLGKLWKHGVPVPFENAISKFTNFDTAYMPFIFADEKVPEHVDTSKHFRVLITSQEFMIEKKYGGVYKALGHRRVMVAANNLQKTLQFHKDDELEKNDLDALSDRMWVVEASAKTTALLERWTHQEKVELAQRGIAEHVRYLESKYKMRESNTRFAVRPGAHDTSVSQHLTLTDPQARVILSLIKMSMDVDSKGNRDDGVYWGEQWLRVTAKGITEHEKWSSVTRVMKWTNPRTHLRKVGRDSTLMVNNRCVKCFVVDVELFLAFVEHYQGDDAERYKAMIEGPKNY